jgi:hypothetical protein
VVLDHSALDLFAEDDPERRRISSDALQELAERPSARALSRATVLIGSTAAGAESFRILFSLSPLALHPSSTLLLAAVRIER